MSQGDQAPVTAIKILVEGYRVGNKWGWRMIKAGEVVAFDEGHRTKKEAVAAGRQVATGFYHHQEVEVIELVRRSAR